MKRSLLIIGSLLLSACALGGGSLDAQSITLMSSDGSRTITVQVELAVTEEQRETGLMDRETLATNEGMMFVFDESAELNFWMKNTLIPLDIMYFDAEGGFVNAHVMTPCELDPCPTYSSAAPAQFALEMNSGFRQMNAIGPGWKMEPNEVRKLKDMLE